MGFLDEGQLLFIVFVVLLVYTIRGCWFCYWSFKDDNTGKWITIGELLSTIGFVGILAAVALTRVFDDKHPSVAIVFYASLLVPALAAVVRSELGFKAVRNSYRKIRK